ncbi:MAG: hypothetical protein U0930_00500 [Pirellulales bacterium]
MPDARGNASMAKPLIFRLGDEDIALNINKVDRTKLYGSKEIEAVDEKEQVCELAMLADDGHTMIGRGGTGLLWLDADGKFCDKAALKPVNVHGEEIKPVESSFGQTIKLFDTATVEHYLEHNIRLVYQVEPTSDAINIDALANELRKGTIFTFPYSYRGGLEADAGFLLMNDEDQIMLAVGNPSSIAYITVQNQAAVEEVVEEAEESEGDLMSFDMI